MLPFKQARNKVAELIVQFDYLSTALEGARRTYNEGQLGQLLSSIRELEHKAGDCLSRLQSTTPNGEELRVLYIQADELLQDRVKPAVRHISAGSLEQSVLRDNMLAIFKSKLPEDQRQCTDAELRRRVKLCEELRDSSPATVMAWSATFPVEEWPKMESALFIALLERIKKEISVKRLSNQICIILTGLAHDAPLSESHHFISFFMCKYHHHFLDHFADFHLGATVLKSC